MAPETDFDKTSPAETTESNTPPSVAATNPYRVHVNFIWRTVDDVTYPRVDLKKDVPLQLYTFKRVGVPPHLEAVDPDRILLTRAFDLSETSPASPTTTSMVRCRQFDFRGCCTAGQDCCYVHVVRLDPTQRQPRRRLRQRSQPEPDAAAAAPAAVAGALPPPPLEEYSQLPPTALAAARPATRRLASAHVVEPPHTFAAVTAAAARPPPVPGPGQRVGWYYDPYLQTRAFVVMLDTPPSP